jgi:CRP-like cAMP-binding protein
VANSQDLTARRQALGMVVAGDHQCADVNQLLQMLPEVDFNALNKNLSLVHLSQGNVLAEPGDDVTKVYFPHSGIVSFMVVLDDGAIVQTFMVGRDGAVGAAQALDSKTSINKILVQVSGIASMIERDRLRELAHHHPAVRNVLAAHEQFLVADIQQTAACNARHAIEARTARWILRMRDLAGDDLPVTQEYLAAMIGVRRSSVTEVASTMQTEGAISYSRGKLHISDATALRRFACECHDAVQKNYLSLLGTAWPRSKR